MPEINLDQTPPDDGWIIWHDASGGAILQLGANFTRRLYKATIANEKLEDEGLTEEAKTLDDLTVPLKASVEREFTEPIEFLVVAKSDVLELQQRAEVGSAADSITIQDQSRRLGILDQLLVEARATIEQHSQDIADRDAEIRTLREQVRQAEAALTEVKDEDPELGRAADAAEDQSDWGVTQDDSPINEWDEERLLAELESVSKQREFFDQWELDLSKRYARKVLERRRANRA